MGCLLNALVFRTLAVANPGQLVALSAFQPRTLRPGQRRAVLAFRLAQVITLGFALLVAFRRWFQPSALFWDGIHPTRAAHALVAHEAVRVLAQQ